MALNTPFTGCLDVHEQPPLSAADGMPVSLTSAPEPSDHRTHPHQTLTPRQNLEKDLSYTNHASLVTIAVTSLLIGVSVGIQVLIKFLQALSTTDSVAERDIAFTTNQAAAFSLSALASTVVVVVNLLLKWTIKYFVSREGHDTKTDFEKRVFTMLSMAYVLNTVVMPMVLGAVPFGVRYFRVYCLDSDGRLCGAGQSDASLVRVGRRGVTGGAPHRDQLCLCGGAQGLPDLPLGHAVPGLSLLHLTDAQERVVGAAAPAAGRLVRWCGQDRRAVSHL
eukprot:scaffold45504_cov70-Phaeocystis_antarctica.AAC.5